MPSEKKKSLLRKTAIGPFLIVTGLGLIYFTLFFDLHLRKGLEWIGTQANGSEVDIGRLKTSFVRGTFLLQDLQVTQTTQPSTNLFQVGEIQFQFSWDALLRARFVVNLASVTGILAYTPRKVPGKVVPPSKEPSTGSSFSDKIKAQLMQKIQNEYSASPLASVGSLLAGANPAALLQNFQLPTNLKTLTRINELQTQFNQKQSQWNQTLDSLPGQKDIAALQSQASRIRIGGNPAEIQKQIGEIQGLLQSKQEQTNSITSKASGLTSDVSNFGNAVSELDDLVAADRQSVQSMIKLPNLDSKNLAQQLFGSKILSQLDQVQTYLGLIRKYIPAPSSKKNVPPATGEENWTPKTRHQGRTYEFGRLRSYPRFWLKEAKISSTLGQDAGAGQVEGLIQDASSNQALVGRPMTMELKGNFPSRQISSLSLKGIVDHRNLPKETFSASVGSYPVGETLLSNTDSLKFGFSKAVASSSLEARFEGDAVRFGAKSQFQKVDYQIKASPPMLQSTLQDVAHSVPHLNFDAEVKGTWDHLQIAVRSNLTDALGDLFQRKLQAQLAEARRKLDAMLDEKIGKPKRDLTDRFNSTRQQLTSQIDSRKQQLDAVQSQLQTKLTDAKKALIPKPPVNLPVQIQRPKLPF